MFTLIGETLRRLRREKGLTLQALGEIAGLGRGQLSRIENNHQEATLSTLARILDAQGVSRKEFFRRYELVESEALAMERQEQSGTPVPVEDWPGEIQDALSRVESFVNATLRLSRPVAQGAVEVGDMVVLFRVVPKSDVSGRSEEPGGAPSVPPAPRNPVKPRAKRKR